MEIGCNYFDGLKKGGNQRKRSQEMIYSAPVLFLNFWEHQREKSWYPSDSANYGHLAANFFAGLVYCTSEKGPASAHSFDASWLHQRPNQPITIQLRIPDEMIIVLGRFEGRKGRKCLGFWHSDFRKINEDYPKPPKIMVQWKATLNERKRILEIHPFSTEPWWWEVWGMGGTS